MHDITPAPYVPPTWTHFFATLALGAVCVLTTAAAVSQPAHLTKGLHLADEIAVAQAANTFVDANNVSLNRYGDSWNRASNPSFIRFADLANSHAYPKVHAAANFEIVGTTWSLPTSNYTTQKTGWLNGLHSRLKMPATTEAVIGRMG